MPWPKGRRHTAESIAKMSAAKRGKPGHRTAHPGYIRDRPLDLTPRMVEHLRCMAEGLTVAQTARRMWLSVEGVKSARKDGIYPRLGARNAAHAVHLAHEKGLL